MGGVFGGGHSAPPPTDTLEAAKARKAVKQQAAEEADRRKQVAYATAHGWRGRTSLYADYTQGMGTPMKLGS
jgi:hypothetical protein